MPEAIDNTADRTASLLAALWVRNRPLVEQRLDSLDQAIAAASDGTLSVELREEAADNAHKLAGSLGMYGFPEGTQLAREIEILLDYRTPNLPRLTTLTAELRQTLFPEA
jgi:HPt (histidine-containing phosphotransfer) domain-containing protein